MTLDWDRLDDEAADLAVRSLLDQLSAARSEAERWKHRAAGLRKLIDGLVDLFPGTEDLLPFDYDESTEPRPRGQDAVRMVLEDAPGHWYHVSAVVELLRQREWMPQSSNPANAVRTALERLVQRNVVQKGQGTSPSTVSYRLMRPSREQSKK